MNKILRKPDWLKSNKLGSKNAVTITQYLREYKLHSVCESAKCPNKGECFERGTATFMILGDICTRNCKFCAVHKEPTIIQAPDPQEPSSIAELSKKLNLKHIVITSVTRDDLEDGGASHFVEVIEAIKKTCNKEVTIEVLIPDFKGNETAVSQVVNSLPTVLNHNIETVPRLYEKVRPMADYNQSLRVLEISKKINPQILTKSGLIVGLGEKKEEVLGVMNDLRKIGVDILTIGQYMAPTKEHYPVQEYIHPDLFSYYRQEGEKMGFSLIESAPLVRSSYHAEKARDLLTN